MASTTRRKKHWLDSCRLVAVDSESIADWYFYAQHSLPEHKSLRTSYGLSQIATA